MQIVGRKIIGTWSATEKSNEVNENTMANFAGLRHVHLNVKTVNPFEQRDI